MHVILGTVRVVAIDQVLDAFQIVPFSGKNFHNQERLLLSKSKAVA